MAALFHWSPMAKLTPPPSKDDPRFDEWLRLMWAHLATLGAVEQQGSGPLSAAQATDLTDGGDSAAHYHAADRARANHTGTQLSTTISDFGPAVLALTSVSGGHPALSNLNWTASGHVGTATRVAGFGSSGEAVELTRTGTGTVVVMSAGPSITGTLSAEVITSTGNTTLGNASTDTLNVGNGDLVKDASSMVGIGVTPGSWDTSSGSRAIQFGARGAMAAVVSGAVTGFTNNLRFDGSNWKYIASAAGSAIGLLNGTVEMSTAASGTAGNTATLATTLTIAAGGDTSIGSSALGYSRRLEVRLASSATGGFALGTNDTAFGSVGTALLADFAAASGNTTVRVNGVSAGGAAGAALSFQDFFGAGVKMPGGGGLGVGITPVAHGANAQTLHVDGAANSPELRLTNSTTGTASGSGTILTAISSDSYLSNLENGFFAFSTNATERMRIPAAGGLTLYSEEAIARNADNTFLLLRGGSTAADGGQLVLYGNANATFPGQFKITAQDGSGNTLTGTPAGALEWTGTFSPAGQILAASGDVNGPGYSFAAAGSGNTGLYLSNTDEISVGTNGGQRLKFHATSLITALVEVVGNSLIRSDGTGSNGGIGYATGAGGTVTQGASKSTAVTLDTPVGEITMHNATLNGDTTVTFTLNNSSIAATDLLVCTHASGGTLGSYLIQGRGTGSGTATITVRNITTGNLGEAIVIRFAVIKGVTS